MFGVNYPGAAYPAQSAPSYVVLTIAGVTKDGNGVVLGSCVVRLFRTSTNVLQQTTMSDASTGVYSFVVTDPSIAYYAVAYKAGSPDKAGTTINTLAGV